jgi:hypothetical protein
MTVIHVRFAMMFLLPDFEGNTIPQGTAAGKVALPFAT